MSACTPSNRFEAAAAYLSSSPALSKVSNDLKLELYALFKCITISKTPQAPRPSLFDFTGRAKWDAWDKLGNQSDERGIILWEQRYLEIAQSLGWREGIQLNVVGDRDADSESENSNGRGGSGAGMGVTVSAIPQPPPDPKDQGTLHAFALSNDAKGLLLFLHLQPEANVNSLDDYGYTPLHLAADRGSTSVVKALLDRGADASIQDPDEFTALDLAEVGGHDDIMALIRNHGAP